MKNANELSEVEIAALNLYTAIVADVDSVPTGIMVSDGEDDVDLKDALKVFCKNIREAR